LSPEEWLELEAGLESVLDASVVRYGGSSGPNAYLQATRPMRAQTVDPARVLGGDVHDALPSGPDAAPLKRMMTELQMWLYEHPINTRRQGRGALPVNGLWIWGGGELPASIETSALDVPALMSADAFATGLWRLIDAEPQPLPARLAAGELPVRSPSRSLVLAVTLRQLAGATDGERMTALDQSWIAPALSMLRAGTIRRLRLHLNDRLFTVSRRDLWQLWRRPRPWLELAG
jgi:hypothetical protein